jgi:hypothetical protein
MGLFNLQLDLEYQLVNLVRGLLLASLYLLLTVADDFTVKNLINYTIFYVVMTNGAEIADLDPKIVTTAFLTKTVFTLIDDKIKPEVSAKQITVNASVVHLNNQDSSKN